MEQSFTPGPWATDPETEGESVIGADGILVADCAVMEINGGRPQSVDQDNANLIAAAPDMYAALDAISHALNTGFVDAREILDENSPIRDAIRDALAKARGEA